ncbi:replication-relaxation family protein [Glycomyces sp. A-F 0318]|uniref:replication-relaxation family protein n=1 Tax=Glycomyces amatae TaxID=2881355 RepID=UPI001E508425|nr:replication-relaxation family protein [Glycomyces amatae]MCD0444294.1 replication-relaxation family protein [Glycomyces amatae]
MPRPRLSAAQAALAAMTARLTDRDFQIIDHLARFKVMTTPQLAAVHFPSANAAKLRLRALTELGILARTRQPNSGRHRYTLDWAGQAVHALRTGTRPPSQAEAAWEVQRRFLSPTRAHDEGAVEAVAALHLACRQHGGAQLTEWLSETEAAWEFQGLRPDAAFTLTAADGRSLMAWYEHDTGTETLERLAAKITAYTERRSPLLPYTRRLLIGCATTARVRALTDRVTDTANLTVAAALHQGLPPVSQAAPDTTGLLTAPSWHRLGFAGRACSLLDLTH